MAKIQEYDDKKHRSDKFLSPLCFFNLKTVITAFIVFSLFYRWKNLRKFIYKKILLFVLCSELDYKSLNDLHVRAMKYIAFVAF